MNQDTGPDPESSDETPERPPSQGNPKLPTIVVIVIFYVILFFIIMIGLLIALIATQRI